jgi:predicted ABC-type ATPase
MNKPKLYIIAGPNGSGKTTLVQRFLPYYVDCINFVNADLITSGLSPFSPETVAPCGCKRNGWSADGD